MNKYKLTKKTKKYLNTTLYQIEALKDFGNASKGDKGGWIEKEDNLSQEGECWVYGNARVYGDAWVSGDARVSGKRLIGGYFYHTKSKSEDIEKIEFEGSDYEILCSNPIFDEEKPVSIIGKEVEEKIDGKKYKAIIQEG